MCDGGDLPRNKISHLLGPILSSGYRVETWNGLGVNSSPQSSIEASSESNKYVTSSLVLSFIPRAWRVLQKMAVLSSPCLVLETRGLSFCVISPWIHQISTHKYQAGPWGHVGHKSERGQEKILPYCIATWPSHQISQLLWRETLSHIVETRQ